jgi:hypothetical protein
LIALPLLAAARAMWEFFGERLALEPWEGREPLPVDVGLEEAGKRTVRVSGSVEGARGNREVPPTDSAAESR